MPRAAAIAAVLKRPSGPEDPLLMCSECSTLHWNSSFVRFRALSARHTPTSPEKACVGGAGWQLFRVISSAAPGHSLRVRPLSRRNSRERSPSPQLYPCSSGVLSQLRFQNPRNRRGRERARSHLLVQPPPLQAASPRETRWSSPSSIDAALAVHVRGVGSPRRPVWPPKPPRPRR